MGMESCFRSKKALPVGRLYHPADELPQCKNKFQKKSPLLWTDAIEEDNSSIEDVSMDKDADDDAEDDPKPEMRMPTAAEMHGSYWDRHQSPALQKTLRRTVASL